MCTCKVGPPTSKEQRGVDERGVVVGRLPVGVGHAHQHAALARVARHADVAQWVEAAVLIVGLQQQAAAWAGLVSE